jgi:hypothetical protein
LGEGWKVGWRVGGGGGVDWHDHTVETIGEDDELPPQGCPLAQ